MSILSRPLLTAQDKLYPKLVKTRFCPTKPLYKQTTNSFDLCRVNNGFVGQKYRVVETSQYNFVLCTPTYNFEFDFF